MQSVGVEPQIENHTDLLSGDYLDMCMDIRTTCA